VKDEECSLNGERPHRFIKGKKRVDKRRTPSIKGKKSSNSVRGFGQEAPLLGATNDRGRKRLLRELENHSQKHKKKRPT